LEIEERATGLAECLELLVEGSGCQGNCGQAPSALVIFNPDQEEGGKEEKKFSHVSTLESSQLVKWNQTLGCIVQMEAFKQSSMNHQEDTHQLIEKAEILHSAGYCHDACSIMEELVRRLSGNPRILLLTTEVLTSLGSLEAAPLGRVQEVLMRAQSMSVQVQLHWIDANNEQLSEIEDKLLERNANGMVTSNGSASLNRGQVEGYSRWRLAEIRVLVRACLTCRF
jgi:hypothetical protein